MTPTVFDIIVSVILLLSMGIAWYRGLIREVFTIIGLALASWISYIGGHVLIPQYNKWLNVTDDGGEAAARIVTEGAKAGATSTAAMKAAAFKEELIFGVISPGLAAKVLAYGTVFLGVFIVVALLTFFLSRSVQEMGLGVLDRIAGGAFGLARGFALIFVPYALYVTFMGGKFDATPDWVNKSTSGWAMETAYEYTDKRFELTKYVKPQEDGKVEVNIQDVLKNTEAKTFKDQAIEKSAEFYEGLTGDELNSPIEEE